MNEEKIAILEGVLFLSGDDGVTVKQIKNVLGIKVDEARTLVELLKADVESNPSRGLMIAKMGDEYKFVTKPVHREYYEDLIENQAKAKLSGAAVETLAIIAYNAPITRMEIEDIRGVSSDSMLRKLAAKDLIEEVGRTEGPGRPVLYNVTRVFMDHFGLESLKELPTIEDTVDKELDGQDIFTTRYTEE